MFHSINVTMIFKGFTTSLQELEFNMLALGVKLFGVGVESESKISDFNHLWWCKWEMFWFLKQRCANNF